MTRETRELFEELKSELMTSIIDSDASSEAKGKLFESMNELLSKTLSKVAVRELQLINHCDILNGKIDDLKQKAEDEFEPRVYSQAEIDSWNGMGK